MNVILSVFSYCVEFMVFIADILHRDLLSITLFLVNLSTIFSAVRSSLTSTPEGRHDTYFAHACGIIFLGINCDALEYIAKNCIQKSHFSTRSSWLSAGFLALPESLRLLLTWLFKALINGLESIFRIKLKLEPPG